MNKTLSFPGRGPRGGAGPQLILPFFHVPWALPAQAGVRRAVRVVVMALLAATALVAGPALAPQAVEAVESCVTCHRNPDFQVTNKKLFDYFHEWELSIHAQEGITCSDCHGGNPKAKGKKQAHGSKGIGAAARSSPVNYQNIPKTCAQCHEEYYEQYRKSKHFAHLVDKEKKRQGPNCVTCHQSVSTAVLNVNTVRGTCESCHNKKTGNHPEIPDRAEFLLNKFLSIHRFYRYLTVKGGVLNGKEVFKRIEQDTENLFIEWHTFDLDAIDTKTHDLLKLLKEKRNEIRKRLPRRRERP